VLVDGATVNETRNAVDFSNFTLDNIDKVEVVRGAESALGTDAVAGVIQVFTHSGTRALRSSVLFGEGGRLLNGTCGGRSVALVHSTIPPRIYFRPRARGRTTVF